MNILHIPERKQRLILQLKGEDIAVNGYRSIIEKMSAGWARFEKLAVDGREFICRDMNLAYSQLTGVERQTAIDVKITEISASPDASDLGWLSVLEGATLHGETAPVVRYSRSKGCRYEITAYRNEAEFVDVLLRPQESSIGLFETVPYIVLLVDRNARIWDANQTACDFWSVQKSELMGKLCGSVINCIHSETGLGCGRNPACAKCVVRSSVAETIEERFSIRNREAQTVVRRDDRLHLHHVLISTVLSGENDDDMVFLTLVDITDRKQMEEQLAESEEEFRQISENVAEVFWLRSADNKEMLYINPAYEMVWGRTCKSLYENPESFIDTVYDEDKPAVFAAFAEYVNTGEFNLEYRIVRPSGELRWVYARSFPVKDSAGNIIRHTGLAVDTTERKEAEQQLAKRDQLLTKLSQHVPGAIYQYRFHPDGRSCFPFASDGIWGIYEVSSEDVRDDAAVVYSRIHPEDHDRVVASIRESYETLEVWEDEYRVVLPEQGLRWVRGVARPEKLTDNSVLWHGYLTDVTEMKRVALELQSQRNLLEAIIDGMHDVVAIQYPDHTIERYNKAGYQMLGLTPDQVKGRKCYELLEQTNECEVCATSTALRSKKMETVERYIPEMDVYLLCHSTPILDVNGKVERVVEQLRDVTESKRQEVRLREEREYMFRIFNSMNQYVIVDGMDHHIQYMNQKAIDDFGDLVGRLCYEQLGGVSPCVQCPVDQLKNGHMTSHYTINAFDRVLEGTATLLTNLDGTESVLEVLEDITERKQAEEKLIEYNAELELQRVEMDRLYNTLDTEMQNARQAHQRLVQQRLPEPSGMSLAVSHNPATYIGGDFAYAIQKNDLLILYITDITGHGLEGTIFGLFVKGCIESYLELAPEVDIAPDKILTYLDEQVHRGGYPSEYAVAIFLMVVNVATREAMFSAAGFQNPPVLVSEDGSIRMLESPGLPISPDIPGEVMEFEHHTTELPENALVFLSTDGIYEQVCDGHMYEPRLLALLEQCGNLPKETMADLTRNDFQAFCGETEQSDDVTCMILSTQCVQEYRLPSASSSLETAREYVLAHYQDHHDREGVAMAVHELVTNAMEHGNKWDETKAVRIVFSDRAVVIEDEGDGFDWRAKVAKELSFDCGAERGRGISMVQMLVGKLVYNEKGNRVSLLLESSPLANEEEER